MSRRSSAGDVLYSPGDEGWDMFVVLEGRIDIVERYRMPATRVVVSYGPGEFSGEIGMLTGSRSTLDCVAAKKAGCSGCRSRTSGRSSPRSGH